MQRPLPSTPRSTRLARTCMPRVTHPASMEKHSQFWPRAQHDDSGRNALQQVPRRVRQLRRRRVGQGGGKRIAKALGNGKAVILQNHGLLTVGGSVDEAAFWFISLDKT